MSECGVWPRGSEEDATEIVDKLNKDINAALADQS